MILLIGTFAFNGLTAVSKYDIGADVSTISQWALDTSSAKVFNLNGNTNFQTDVDGVLFSKDGTTLIAYPGGLYLCEMNIQYLLL